jgi:hypothetical protein
MSEKYFVKFPTITYSNTTCLDITRRVTLETGVSKSPVLYYPYTIKTGARPDVIADNYYDDAYYDWLLFLNNGIVDPYYDWYLNDYDFNLFLIKKYGSIAIAQQKISHYELNYLGSEDEITADNYTNHLPEILKKYFTPIYGYGSKVISYKRRVDLTVRNTNRLVKLQFISNVVFTTGSVVDVKSNTNSSVVGGGEVTFTTANTIVLKNINGSLAVNNYVSNNKISNSTILFQNISDAEYVYWRPKTFYDVEFDNNDKNKNIRMVGANYAQGIAENLRIALKD